MAKKVTLDRTWLYQGRLLGPGPVALTDEAHAAIRAAGGLPQPPAKAEKQPTSGEGKPGQSGAA